MAEKKVAIDVVLNARGAAKSLGDLRQASEDLAQALESQELGSKAFKQLSSELTQANKEIKNLELGFESLDTEQQAAELGSVAGAVGDVTTAFVLLGGENETMQQIASSIQNAIGVSMAFKGAIEGVTSARKLLTNADKESLTFKIKDAIATKAQAVAQTAYTFVTGKATKATKLFKVALASTGIGLLVVGIGLLVANWESFVKWIKKSSKALGEFASYFLPIRAFIEWWTGKTYEQIEAEEQASKQRKEEHKANLNRIKEQIKANTEQAKAFRKAKQDEIDINDQKIRILENEGKTSYALRLQVLEDNLAIQQSYLDEFNNYVNLQRKKWEENLKYSGLTEEAFRAQMKAQGIDLEALETQANEITESIQLNVAESESEITALKRTEAEKQSAIAKTAAEKKIAAEQKVKDEADKIKEQNEKDAEKLRLQNEKEADELFKLKTGIAKRIADFEKEEFQLKLDELAAQYEAEKLLFVDNEEALLLLEEEYRTKRGEIELEASKADDEKAKEDRQKKISDAQEQAEALIGIAQSFHDIASTISEAANSKELDRIKKKQDAGEKLSEGEIELLIKAEKTKRALAVSQIAIDTATSIASVIAGAASAAANTGPAAPFVLAGYIASGIATVLGSMASASKILSAPMPDFQTPSSTSPDEDTDEDENLDAPDTDLFNTGSTLLNEGMGKVYVLEQDITDTQNNVASIKDQATFG